MAAVDCTVSALSGEHSVRLQQAIDPARRAVCEHPLYALVRDHGTLATFMAHHIRALDANAIPAASRDFVFATMAMVDRGSTHELAAAFTFGREDAVPMMFRRLLTVLPDAPEMRTYLERHVALDAGVHAGQALELLVDLCGQDAARWREATDAAVGALEARLRLWDAIHATLT